MQRSLRQFILPVTLMSLCTASLFPTQVKAQFKETKTTDSSSLSAMLDNDDAAKAKEYVKATFKTTRLINGHSIENTGRGILDFKISHRFNPIDGGGYDFFGLDGATLRLGLDYGITDWLTVGVGRSTYQKEYDGFGKAAILRQTTDDATPISLSYLGAMSVTTLYANQLLGRSLQPNETYNFSSRLFYTNQILIARKFSPALSLQLMPTHIHYNLVNLKSDPNDVFALGAGGRIKLNKRVSLNVEYYYQLNHLQGSKNAFSIGFDIETGGHVFQLMFTNSTGMTERTFIGQTTNNFGDNGIRFGFNIARVFTVVKDKSFKDSRNKIW